MQAVQTGNRARDNPSTAHFYSDLSLLTSDPEITSAVHAVFNYLTARSEQTDYRPLFVAPVDLAKNSRVDSSRGSARAP